MFNLTLLQSAFFKTVLKCVKSTVFLIFLLSANSIKLTLTVSQHISSLLSLSTLKCILFALSACKYFFFYFFYNIHLSFEAHYKCTLRSNKHTSFSLGTDTAKMEVGTDAQSNLGYSAAGL